MRQGGRSWLKANTKLSLARWARLTASSGQENGIASHSSLSIVRRCRSLWEVIRSRYLCEGNPQILGVRDSKAIMIAKFQEADS
jgi:hypothetical protein